MPSPDPLRRPLVPLAEGVRQIRELVHLPPFETFPIAQATLIALAGIVGLLGGVAVGLFSNFIALFQLLLYRPQALVSAISGSDATWRAAFRTGLAHAAWRPELLVLALVGLGASRYIAKAAEGGMVKLPRLVEAQRIRALGWLLGFGLFLYYPLLVLTTFNRAFGEIHGRLLELVTGLPAYWVVLGPALGAFAAGWLVRRMAPEAGGHGVVEVLEAVHGGKRRIPARVAVWKSVITGLTIGSGGSAGREGPVVHIGAAIAGGLARRFSLQPDDLSLLLACGGGAGVAASFNAPVAGTVFALEILLGDFSMRAIAPAAFAAVAATLTGRALIGAGGELEHVPFRLESGVETIPYVLLGVLASLVAVVYVRGVHTVERWYHDGPLARFPFEIRTMVSGLLVGAIGYFMPRALGNGYETMNAALLGQLGAGMLLAVLAAKLATTSLTLGSGTPGGSFFPAVFLGAMLGGAMGALGREWFPTVVAGPGPYAAVGMAAVVAGAIQGPLTAVMMLVELTGSQQIVLPLLVACATSVAGTQWILGGSIYTLNLRARGVRMRRQRSGPPGPLVEEIMTRELVLVPESAPLAQVAAGSAALVVVDATGRFVGLVDTLVAPVGAVAADVCRRDVPLVFAGETVDGAVARGLDLTGIARAVVVDGPEQLHPVGTLSAAVLVRALGPRLTDGEAPRRAS